MRAFGPGSVSSFLKTVLDVIVYALWAGAGVTALGLVLSLLVQPFAANGSPDQFGVFTRYVRRGPALPLLMGGAMVWLLALLATADRLRRVFTTLIEGRPFRPENVDRLRAIGLALIVLELAGYALPMLAAPVFGAHAGGRREANLSAWFSILVVFVLAEVFREGSRLQAEAELTV